MIFVTSNPRTAAGRAALIGLPGAVWLLDFKLRPVPI